MKLNLNKTPIATLEQEYVHANEAVAICIEDLRMLADVDVDISEEALKEVFISISKKYKEFTERFINLTTIAKKRYKTEYSIWVKKEIDVIRNVHSLKYDDVKDIMIDYPTGMTLTYFNAIGWIVNIFNKFEATADLKLISTALDQTFNSISNDSDGHESTIKVANNTILNSSKKLMIGHKTLVSGFSTSSISAKQKAFGDMFKSMDELHKTFVLAGDADEYVIKSPLVSDHAINVEKVLDLIIELMQDKITEGDGSYVPSKEFIKTFASFVELIDNLYIVYGDCVIRTLAVHHNLTFVYRTLSTR